MGHEQVSRHQRPEARGLELIPQLHPIYLHFVDAALEAEFKRDLIPRRRRVGTANYLGLIVITAVIWVSQALIVPGAGTRLAGPMLAQCAVALVGAALFRRAPERWFDVMNAFAGACGAVLTSMLVSVVGPAFALAAFAVSVSGLLQTGTFPFLRSLGITSGTVVLYLVLVTVSYDYTAAATLVQAGALLMAITVGVQRGRLYARVLRENWFNQRLADRLLDNMLPNALVPRLKAGAGTIADRHDSATVLFADLVGFTQLSARMQPETLVKLLDEVFSEFDTLAERHGLEKIKTIGDAYMLAGGIPETRPDHAAAVARMALDMRTALARWPELSVRVGLHTGPVVAGVIGRRKFAYDLWGDTVNTASRMESHGAPGEIHVSDACREALGAGFTLEERGVVDVKGKGPMHTWWLRGVSPG